MNERPARLPEDADRFGDAAFRLVVVMAAVLVALAGLRIASDAVAPVGGTADGVTPGNPSVGALGPSPTTPAADPAAFLLGDIRPAPPLELGGPGGTASRAGPGRGLVLVFFGYTHCPDVCPATIGTVGMAIDAYGPGARAILVSVDPERDTPEWLAEFVRYMPQGFSAVTGTPSEIQRTAAAWGVRYAKVETDDPSAYTMSHTADVFVVDEAGMIRARFPFGTDAQTMTAVLRTIQPPDATPAATQAPTAAPETAVPTERPVDDLEPVLVSSAVWAGAATPVIFTFDDPALETGSVAATVSVQAATAEGTPVGPAVSATRVQPVGVDRVSFVAEIALPEPGSWTLSIAATDGSGTEHRGVLPLSALDPGSTAPIGEPAPRAATKTPAEVGGNLTWLTTDPLPDPRLSATSTTAALDAGRPFVLVVDSIAFRVTPQCGQAVVMAKRLVDRWASVPFIHHEPYRYEVVTTEPVIEGSLEEPRLTEVADAWGVGSQPWGVASMPWLFVVDGNGIVRAKYQGVIGSADVDVMLTLLAGGSSDG